MNIFEENKDRLKKNLELTYFGIVNEDSLEKGGKRAELGEKRIWGGIEYERVSEKQKDGGFWKKIGKSSEKVSSSETTNKKEEPTSKKSKGSVTVTTKSGEKLKLNVGDVVRHTHGKFENAGYEYETKIEDITENSITINTRDGYEQKNIVFNKSSDPSKYQKQGSTGQWDYIRVLRKVDSKEVESREKEKEDKKPTTSVKIDKEKVKSIASKQPNISSYGGKGGNYRIDEESNTIEFNHNFPREARHPEEYGERGRKAEQKMEVFTDKFYNEVYEPLTKLGYKVEMYAF
jgi:hypothetical protein